MAEFSVPESNIKKNPYRSEHNMNLVFDIFLPRTNIELRSVSVDLYKTTKFMLKKLACELEIHGYKKMQKTELARLLTAQITFNIPDSLKIYKTGFATNAEKNIDVPQLYIPLEWQTSITNTKTMFQSGSRTVIGVNQYTYPFKDMPVVLIRELCTEIGIHNPRKLTKDELIDLLEDKIVFQERAG